MEILINLLNITPFNIFKICFLLVEFFYIGFAYILFRQQKLMAQTIEISLSSFFRFLTFIHFLTSLIVFVFSLLILLV